MNRSCNLLQKGELLLRLLLNPLRCLENNLVQLTEASVPLLLPLSLPDQEVPLSLPDQEVM